MCCLMKNRSSCALIIKQIGIAIKFVTYVFMVLIVVKAILELSSSLNVEYLVNCLVFNFVNVLAQIWGFKTGCWNE